MSRVEPQPNPQQRRDQQEPSRRPPERQDAQPGKPSKAEGEEQDVEEALRRE
ncbi:MAG TPA: hypothetical protein VGR02_17785 [Thermoanaerobaculia bacterium]|jgi:hypothetical protein|nr:hypothetical protein [Thermoanaerobaculia bacterium]